MSKPSGGEVYVEIDISQVKNMAAHLSKVAMMNAWDWAQRKTMNWIRSRVGKEVGKAEGIPQKVIRERFRMYMKPGTGKAWLGLNPIEAERLGYPRRTGTGITAGRHEFPHAWVMRYRHPEGPVFRRTGERKRSKRSGKMVKVFERVRFDWSWPGEAAFRNVVARAEERLLTILRQEVNYEIHKAIGNAR